MSGSVSSAAPVPSPSRLSSEPTTPFGSSFVSGSSFPPASFVTSPSISLSTSIRPDVSLIGLSAVIATTGVHESLSVPGCDVNTRSNISRSPAANTSGYVYVTVPSPLSVHPGLAVASNTNPSGTVTVTSGISLSTFP